MHWYPQAEPAKCAVSGHNHLTFEVHNHRLAVALPEGTQVVAVSFDPRDAYARDRPPDFGLYLDARWQPPWDHQLLAWPDFGLPDGNELVTALGSLLERARAGQRVEIGCIGGHGRTGTALATLAVLTGCPSIGAVAWARANYCPQAVETAEQEAFVARIGAW